MSAFSRVSLSDESRARGGRAAAAELDPGLQATAVGGRSDEQDGDPARVAEKDDERFGALYDAHVDRARRLAWRLLGGDTAAAEDVVQDAFVKAYRGLERFRGDAELSSWLYRIVVNESHNHRRWRGVRQRFRDLFVADERGRGESDLDPLLRDRVARALDRLSRAQREAFVLVALESMTMRQAAEILRCSEGSIKTHLHRARALLRRELADLQMEPDDE